MRLLEDQEKSSPIGNTPTTQKLHWINQVLHMFLQIHKNPTMSFYQCVLQTVNLKFAYTQRKVRRSTIVLMTVNIFSFYTINFLKFFSLLFLVWSHPTNPNLQLQIQFSLAVTLTAFTLCS